MILQIELFSILHEHEYDESVCCNPFWASFIVWKWNCFIVSMVEKNISHPDEKIYMKIYEKK